jgi:hypothetical protein
MGAHALFYVDNFARNRQLTAVKAIMKNLFDTPVYNEAITRLNRLSPESQRQWGKMDVAQMLAHVSQSFKVPLTKSKLPRIFHREIIGPAI